MHYFEVKYNILPLCFLWLTEFVSSIEEEKSAWQNIVDSVTVIAKDAGLYQAGEPCNDFLKDDNTCLEKWRVEELWREVESKKIPYLECNKVKENVTGYLEGRGVCQLKSWFIILMFAIIVIITLTIMACICCCCFGCCSCCCPYAPLKEYRQ